MALISWRNGNCIYCYECAVCDRKWATKFEVSTCGGCKAQYLPQTDTRFSSRRTKKVQLEQMGLGSLP